MRDRPHREASAEGGCQCGAIRYAVKLSEALTLYRCHCRECQKQASSAFGMSMILPAEAFAITQGSPKSWSRSADSGRSVECFFCEGCGSRLFHKSPSRPGKINLKPGTLDDPRRLQPIGDLWTDSRQAWVTLLPEGLAYAGQPEDFDALTLRYRAVKNGSDAGG